MRVKSTSDSAATAKEEFGISAIIALPIEQCVQLAGRQVSLSGSQSTSKVVNFYLLARPPPGHGLPKTAASSTLPPGSKALKTS